MPSLQTKLLMARISKELSKSETRLMPHQVDAVKWMLKRESSRKSNGDPKSGPLGGILADDMGLGKTLQTICLLLGGRHKKSLIIVPANLIAQWKSEINRFAPDIKVVDTVDEHTDDSVLILSYIKAIRSSYIREYDWTRIILDEAHYIRNAKGTVHKGMLELKSQKRWCLTGTPIQNYKSDICSLLAFLGIRKKKYTHLDKYIEKYLLRRTKKALNIQMPSLTEHVDKVTLSNQEKQLYEKVKNDSFVFTGVHHLELLLRRRQAALLPQMVVEGYQNKKTKTHTQKIPDWKHSNTKLDKIVQTIVDNPSEKPIVFCYFTKEIQYLQHRFTEQQIAYKVINGSVNMADRQSIIKSADKYRVLICQMMAGSTGLNMEQFNSVYFSGPHWNPTHEQQAIARVYRIGQSQPVSVRRFIMKDTIEELIVHIQERKNKLIKEHLE